MVGTVHFGGIRKLEVAYSSRTPARADTKRLVADILNICNSMSNSGWRCRKLNGRASDLEYPFRAQRPDSYEQCQLQETRVIACSVGVMKTEVPFLSGK